MSQFSVFTTHVVKTKNRNHSMNIGGELVKTTTLEQDPPNHKIVSCVCLHPPCLTSKDGVIIA